MFDLCALDGARPILCEAIEAYVNECQDRGVTVQPWRNESFCRKSYENEETQNTKHWHYQERERLLKGKSLTFEIL